VTRAIHRKLETIDGAVAMKGVTEAEDRGGLSHRQGGRKIVLELDFQIRVSCLCTRPLLTPMGHHGR